MSNLSRKSFLTAIAASTAATTLGISSEPKFIPINPNNHYFITTTPDLIYSGNEYIWVFCRLFFMNITNNQSDISTRAVFCLQEVETGNIITVNDSWLREFFRRDTAYIRELMSTKTA